jgi:hypothetical protein
MQSAEKGTHLLESARPISTHRQYAGEGSGISAKRKNNPMHGKIRRPLIRLCAAGSLIALGLGAAPAAGHAQSAAHPGSMPAISLKVSSFLFPKTLGAGTIKVTVVNDTKSEAEAGFGRLNPGYTTADALTIIKSNSEQSFVKALKELTFVGGAASIQPGQTAVVYVTLTPGTYGVVNTDGQTPQYRFFSVTSGSGGSVTPPKATAVVRFKDFSFVGLPPHFAAGPVTFKLDNVGKQAHDMELVRLDPGKTMQDVLKALMDQSPPKWAHNAGGVDTMSPHTSTVVTLTLAPGNYVALCFMPDVTKKDMPPHAMEGMIAAFTVS